MIIGRNVQGEPSLRKTSYGARASNALQLIAVNGRRLSRNERAAIYTVQAKDEVFSDWRAAANAACAQLRTLFPHADRDATTMRSRAHRYLEDALRITHARLDRWDPLIEFYGLPNEAQMGFPLIGVAGKQGELVFREPDMWLLHWHAPPDVVIESWSIATQQRDAADATKQERHYRPDRRVHRRRATAVKCRRHGSKKSGAARRDAERSTGHDR